MAAATDNRDAIAVLDRHCRPITNRGKRHARLNPVAKEDLAQPWPASTWSTALPTATSKPASATAPRPTPPRPNATVRSPGQLSVIITKLRGHGLIAKVPRRRLYRVTRYGQRHMAAAVAVHDNAFHAAYLKLAA